MTFNHSLILSVLLLLLLSISPNESFLIQAKRNVLGVSLRATPTSANIMKHFAASSDLSSSGTFPTVPSLRDCLAFVIPALAIYTSGPLMTLIDAAFIGRSSSLALAAVGPAGAIADSATQLLLFLSIAATNLVASANAEKNAKGIRLTTVVSLSCKRFYSAS